MYRLQTVHHKTIHKQNVSNNIITPFLSHYMITENSRKSFNYRTSQPMKSHVTSSRLSVRHSMDDHELASLAFHCISEDMNTNTLEHLTAVTMKSSISQNVTPSSLVETHQHFGGTYCIHLQGWWVGQWSNQQEEPLPEYMMSILDDSTLHGHHCGRLCLLVTCLAHSLTLKVEAGKSSQILWTSTSHTKRYSSLLGIQERRTMHTIQS